jgi:hypothetical protein
LPDGCIFAGGAHEPLEGFAVAGVGIGGKPGDEYETLGVLERRGGLCLDLHEGVVVGGGEEGGAADRDVVAADFRFGLG